jgi:hypothetical protein
MDQIESEFEPVIINNIKQEPEVEFLQILPSFNPQKTLGGKFIKVEKEDQEEKTEKTEKPQSNFECDLCNKTYPRKMNLGSHLKHHFVLGKYKCICCLTLFDLNGLRFHANKDQKSCQRITQNDLICKICGKVCRTFDARKYHEKVHGDKIQCNICEKYFKQHSIKPHLKLHELKKHERKIKCGHCPMKFFTRFDMKCHEKIHNRFECDICGWKIANKSYFRQHMTAHVNPNALKCEHCGKNFSIKLILNRHIKNIHPEKAYGKNVKFICELCQKEFKSHIYLENHEIRVHKKKKPCPICSEPLAPGTFKSHLRTHEKTSA